MNPKIDYPTRLTLARTTKALDSTVTLPGSKSITNRALVIASLASGNSRLRGVLQSDDTEVMQSALRSVGVGIIDDSPTELTVSGSGGRYQSVASDTLFIGNSGTSVRFLSAALTQIPDGTSVTLDGVPRMRHRPISPLMETLRLLGATIKDDLRTGCPPVTISGGKLAGGNAMIDGDISSQFLSAVMMVSPYADSDVTLSIAGELISKPYVDLTAGMMRDFGATVEVDDYKTVRISSGAHYTGRVYEVEADASNASYFMAAAAITGGNVVLSNLSGSAKQGDIHFVDVLESMGCLVDRGDTVRVVGPTKLRAGNWNMEAIPDTAQTLAVLACFADGTSNITGIGSLRVKETDRVTAISNELRKLGATVDEGDDYWRITPPIYGFASEVSIDTYDDHRMAMSFAVAGLVRDGVTINDPACVAKTFPDFWQRWAALTA